VQIAKLVLVNAQAYTEGVGEMATLPKLLAYMGVSVLKSVPVRFYANTLIFTGATYSFLLDAMRVGRLHTLMPGWADATVSFMLSGGYNVAASISQVQQETLVIWGEQDKIVSRTFAEVRLRETQVARKLSYDFLNSFLVAYVHIAFGLLT
jgi:pimeloyl-ACP methyl ester carboxylesterase